MGLLFDNDTKLNDHEGHLVEFPKSRLHSKTVALLFVDPTQRDGGLRHILDFYNRTNGFSEDTLNPDGTRGHSVEIINVCVNEKTLTASQQHDFASKLPWLSLSFESCEKRAALLSEYCPPARDDLIFPRMVVVNWDGSIISENGIVEIVSSGDAALMKWQMNRKPDPIDEPNNNEDFEEQQTSVLPKAKEKQKTTKSFGGVQVELPF